MFAAPDITDALDTFPADVRRACNAVAYGAGVADPLLEAAAEILLEDYVPANHPTASNGRLRFAVFVSARAVRP